MDCRDHTGETTTRVKFSHNKMGSSHLCLPLRLACGSHDRYADEMTEEASGAAPHNNMNTPDSPTSDWQEDSPPASPSQRLKNSQAEAASPRMKRMRSSMYKTLHAVKFLEMLTPAVLPVHEPKSPDSEGLTGPYIARWASHYLTLTPYNSIRLPISIHRDRRLIVLCFLLSTQEPRIQ